MCETTCQGDDVRKGDVLLHLATMPYEFGKGYSRHIRRYKHQVGFIFKQFIHVGKARIGSEPAEKVCTTAQIITCIKSAAAHYAVARRPLDDA